MNLLAPSGANLDLEDITERLNCDTMSGTGAQTSPHPEHISGTSRTVPVIDHHTSSYEVRSQDMIGLFNHFLHGNSFKLCLTSLDPDQPAYP
jgi:hypothetical protein